MNSTWAETKMQLAMLRQEHAILCQEARATTDYEYACRLYRMALACMAEFEKVLEQYRHEYTAQKYESDD